jgi:hypothetical protein
VAGLGAYPMQLEFGAPWQIVPAVTGRVSVVARLEHQAGNDLINHGVNPRCRLGASILRPAERITGAPPRSSDSSRKILSSIL